MRSVSLFALGLVVVACGTSTSSHVAPPFEDEAGTVDPTPDLDGGLPTADGAVAAPPDAADAAPDVQDAAPPFVFEPHDINHILGAGQSLATGAASTAESTTQPYGNVMLAFGVQANRGFSEPFVPLVESGYETMSSSLANELTRMAALDGIPSYVSLISVHAGGGTPYSGVAKGTELFQRGMDQVNGATIRSGLDGKTHVVRAVTSVHGESDTAARSTTYASDIIQWQKDYEAGVKAITGQQLPVPMFHTQNSQNGRSRIPLDMLAAHVAAPGRAILVGPKYHLAYLDGTHLTTASYKHLGEDYAKAIRRVVLQGKTWEPVRPKTVTRSGNVITITFHVPAPPLALDTTRVAATAHFGFDYVPSETPMAMPAPYGQNPTVQSVTVTGPDTVQITLSSIPPTPGRIRYGITYVDPNGPRGNLRDSDATVSRYGFDLFNWCVQFEEPIP